MAKCPFCLKSHKSYSQMHKCYSISLKQWKKNRRINQKIFAQGEPQVRYRQYLQSVLRETRVEERPIRRIVESKKSKPQKRKYRKNKIPQMKVKNQLIKEEPDCQIVITDITSHKDENFKILQYKLQNIEDVVEQLNRKLDELAKKSQNNLVFKHTFE